VLGEEISELFFQQLNFRNVNCDTKSVLNVKSSPVTGLKWPRGFQEVKVPRFNDNGTGRW